MNAPRIALAVIMLALVAAADVRAEGWRDWVPFAGQESDDPPAKTKKKKKPVAAAKKDPSLWQRMDNGTRRFFRSTANMLSFKDEPEPRPVSGQLRRYKARSADRDEDEARPGWFSGWFDGAQDEPPEPETPQEWIAQPRPGF
jgi:hypothetical protein